MTLPNSGPLSLQDIANEFGGGSPLSLSNYYAGGGRVPNGTSGVNGPVPSNGALAISNFYGTSNYGPFTATGGGVDQQGASGTGPSRGIIVQWGPYQSEAIVISGGPTSGSFSYAWSYQSGDNTISLNSTGIAQPMVSQNGNTFIVGPQSTATDSATWQCLITDTVSGRTYLLSGVVFAFTFTNNTG